MSADEWDADDFEPGTPVVDTDKWEGEDEGDNVKDAWDAEEEDKKVEEGGDGKDDTGVKATQRKKKKPLAERIAEKEAARIEQDKAAKEVAKVLSKEEKQTEAERLKKMQEEADLKLAKEAFGVDSTGIDAMFPITDEEFVKFREALKQKITSFNSSKQYGTFVCDLLSELVVDLTVEDLKKISTSTSSLFHEKQKIQKEADKKKKTKKVKGVKLERESDFSDIAADVHDGDYDDSYYDEDFI